MVIEMQCFGFKTVSKILIVTKCDWDHQSKEQLVLSFWNIGEQANAYFTKLSRQIGQIKMLFYINFIFF